MFEKLTAVVFEYWGIRNETLLSQLWKNCTGLCFIKTTTSIVIKKYECITSSFTSFCNWYFQMYLYLWISTTLKMVINIVWDLRAKPTQPDTLITNTYSQDFLNGFEKTNGKISFVFFYTGYNFKLVKFILQVQFVRKI